MTDTAQNCDWCGKPFGEFKTLRAHVKKTHPEHWRPLPGALKYGEFPCLHCDRSFMLAGFLKQHMRNLHRGVNRAQVANRLPVPLAVPVSNGKVELHDEPDLIIRVDQHGDPWICRKVNLA